VDQTTLVRAIVLVIAAGLWSSFAFVLGPRLRKEQQHEFYACLTLAGIAFGVLVLHFLSTGWLADAGNATTVQAVAAAAQAAFTDAVIVLTIRTVQANSTMANETKSMADETARMAKETERMAQVAVEQQRAALRPVLVFRIHPVENRTNSPNVKDFIIEVINVGAGPALDTRVFVDGPFKYDISSPPVQPLAIAASEEPPPYFTFEFDSDVPFADSANPLHWPQTPDDEELIRLEKEADKQAGPLAGRDNSAEANAIRERASNARAATQERHIAYGKELLDNIDAMRDAGIVRAEYRDLAGGSHVSTATLVLSPHDWHETATEDFSHNWHDFYPGWRPLTLGPLSVMPTGSV
jgi:hypothetical protein